MAANPRIQLEHVQTNFPPNASLLDERVYDFIIVGAGSAGCVLAEKLSRESGVSVLLLEAGGELQNAPECRRPNDWSTLFQSEADWGYISVPQKELRGPGGVARRLFLERGKTLGGSSTINALMWVRGAPEDFDRWSSQAGAAGWSHAEILPNFKDLETADPKVYAGFDPAYRGTSGPLRVNTLPPKPEHNLFMETAERCGFPKLQDYNGKIQSGVAQVQFSVDPATHTRMDAFNAFVQPVLEGARRRRNLTVVSSVFTRKVIVEDGKATGGRAALFNSAASSAQIHTLDPHHICQV
jgi:choline dehydrogenase